MKKKRACLFGLPIDLTNIESATDELLNCKQSAQVVTINPEMISKAYKNDELANIIKSAEIVVPDGVGVVMALKMIGVETSRVPGIELAHKLLEKAEKNNLKVALIGADEDTIQQAKKELLKEMPDLKIVYIRNGYFKKDEENVIYNNLIKANPDILLAGLGFPKQEQFLYNFKKILNNTIMIGVGGSFDVWSKKVKRAPEIFQKLNLEWFYRLLCQPSRFNRIFPAIPLFLIKVPLNNKLHKREY